jgi:hypothetical protein
LVFGWLSQDKEKKKLTDIGLLVFSDWISLVFLDFGFGFVFLRDIGLIDIVPINF